MTGEIQRIPVTRTEEGRPLGLFYGHVVEGIFQDFAEIAESPTQSPSTRPGDIKFKDINNDGMITDEDREFIGSPHPDFTLNVNNSFEFKGFDINIFVQGVYGNEILNLVRRDIEGMVGLSNQAASVKDRFTLANPSSTIPRATGPDPNGEKDGERFTHKVVMNK